MAKSKLGSLHSEWEHVQSIHISLLRYSINYGCKSDYSIGIRSQVYKHFMVLTRGIIVRALPNSIDTKL